jgi:hypothetical protein
MKSFGLVWMGAPHQAGECSRAGSHVLCLGRTRGPPLIERRTLECFAFPD